MDNKYLCLHLPMYYIWNDYNDDSGYRENKLSIPKDYFNTLIPLRYYDGEFKIEIKDHKYKLSISFNIDFTVKGSDLNYLKELYSRDNFKRFDVKIRKCDILRLIDGNQPFNSEFYDIILKSEDIKYRNGAIYFKFNQDYFKEFAGIDSSSYDIPIIIGEKTIKTTFSINCKCFFKGSNDIKNYSKTSSECVNLRILKNEFIPNNPTNDEELYLNHNCVSKNTTLFDF